MKLQEYTYQAGTRKFIYRQIGKKKLMLNKDSAWICPINQVIMRLPIGIMNNESIIRLRHIYTELDKLVLFSIIFIIN